MIFKGRLELDKINPGDVIILEVEDPNEGIYPTSIKIKIDKSIYDLLKDSFSNRLLCIAAETDKKVNDEISQYYSNYYYCCIYQQDVNTKWNYYVCFIDLDFKREELQKDFILQNKKDMKMSI